IAGTETYWPSRSELGDTAKLPATHQLADKSTLVKEPLAWTKRQFVDRICLKHMLHVLVETLFLQSITGCIVEIWRKLSLSLFGVSKRFTPGVVDLIVPTAAEALAHIGPVAPCTQGCAVLRKVLRDET